MNHMPTRLLAGGAVLALAAAGCSSSASKSTGGAGASTGPSAAAGTTAGGALKTVKIGLLSDQTGAAASGNKSSLDGVKAGVVYAARQGYKIQFVVGDTATNPTTALSVAQKMVTQDHVAAVIGVSAIVFAAAPYLTAHQIPVVGAAADGPEWQTAKNMFAVSGASNQTKVSTTAGAFFKSQGVTSVGALGYGISPLSAEATKGAAESAKHAGLKVGYLNANFPFGSTDVGAVALGMKKGGVDGLTTLTDPNTAFSLVTALDQSGVKLKATLLATGYGGDLLQAGPGALRAAQGIFFDNNFELMEMQTAATKQFASDLKSAGITVAPGYGTYNGYTSVGLLVRALKAAGASASSASILKALSGIHDWDGLGLFGGRTVDVSDRASAPAGVGGCLWVAKLEGSVFKTVPGADPICGTIIPGVTVSSN
jgi:ABC-type branched-subunit amino acid transport system substrate-binding protein